LHESVLVTVMAANVDRMSEKVVQVTTALRKVKGNIERMFEKTLSDMIRGIRNSRENETKYIAQCMDEIKIELKNENIAVKANAVAKLTYLQMLGYDISWAAFNIIEVMSAQKFTYKRIGYLAASQVFNENTEVLMLTTNLVKKDINSAAIYDASIALNGLSCFITPDLARDLANDVVSLLTSSKAYIRKRAVLLLYKVYLNFPDSLQATFPRLKEKLEDSDPGVQSATINVVCELARKNPKNYLALAPIFFKLMTTSSNNWMLIKIIKLFGSLTPLEPRLGKKLIEPLTSLINSTSAMSLLYECINTVVAVLISISSEGPGDHMLSIQLCVQKLSVLIEDADQNLKYLGLLAMGKILKTHPKAVQSMKDLILNCLDDKDESIRLRALDLLHGMVSKKNIMDIVKRLLYHIEKVESSSYRDGLLSKIIQICSHSNYKFITNFEWYISVLVELTKAEGTRHGSLIAEQMLDVAVRVLPVRHFAVSQMGRLIENAGVVLSCSCQYRSDLSEVLYAAAWICGEFAEHISDPQSTLETMLRTKVTLMPGRIQSIYIQNIGKIYAHLLDLYETEQEWDRIYSLDNLLLSKLPQFLLSDYLETQERASSLVELVREIEEMHKRNELVSDDLKELFHGDLNPVAPKAQRKVPVPDGLNLDENIYTPPSESANNSDEEEVEASIICMQRNLFASNAEDNFISNTIDEDNLPKKITSDRLIDKESNPHYLKSSKVSKVKSRKVVEPPPPSVKQLDDLVGLEMYEKQAKESVKWKKTKGKKSAEKETGRRKRKSSSEGEFVEMHHHSYEIYQGAGEMPENAKLTDEEEEQNKDVINKIAKIPSSSSIGEVAFNFDKFSTKVESKSSEGAKKKAAKGKKSKAVQRTKRLAAKNDEKQRDEDEFDRWLSGAKEVKEEKVKIKNKKGKGEKKKKAFTKSDQILAQNLNELIFTSGHDRADYEETSGVCIPCLPECSTSMFFDHATVQSNFNVSSSWRLLAEDDYLKLFVQEQVTSEMDVDYLIASILFMNESAESLRQIRLYVTDSVGMKTECVSDNDQAVVEPFSLASKTTCTKIIKFSLSSIYGAQKLKSVLTYVLENKNVKLDFQMIFPCSAFAVSVSVTSSRFAELVGDPSLAYSVCEQIATAPDDDFESILQNMCSRLRLSIVEKLDSSALLFNQTIKGDPICVLLKKSDATLKIECKSTREGLCKNFLEECVAVAHSMVAGGELLTIQIGEYANFIGTHFWNLQNHTLFQESAGKVDSALDWNVLLREESSNGEKIKGGISIPHYGSEIFSDFNGKTERTYTPRVVAFEEKFNVNLNPLISNLETSLDVDSVLLNNFKIEKKEAQPLIRNEFLQDVVENRFSRNGFYNLDDKVNYWADFILQPWHPKSLCLMSDFEQCRFFVNFQDGGNLEISISACFEDCQRRAEGRQIFDEIETHIRFFAEEMDYIEGIQLLCDVSSNLAGMSSTLLRYFKDDYGNIPVLAIPCWPAHLQTMNRLSVEKLVWNSSQSLLTMLSESLSTLPLSLSTELWDKDSQFCQWNELKYEPQSTYHTSAIIAAALETATIPWRCLNSGGSSSSSSSSSISLKNTLDALNNFGQNSIVRLGLSMPFKWPSVDNRRDFSKNMLGLTNLSPCTDEIWNFHNNRPPLIISTLKGYPGCNLADAQSQSTCIENLAGCLKEIPNRIFSTSHPLYTGAPFPNLFNSTVDKHGNVECSTSSSEGSSGSCSSEARQIGEAVFSSPSLSYLASNTCDGIVSMLQKQLCKLATHRYDKLAVEELHENLFKFSIRKADDYCSDSD
ncbi:AP-3 complex subunit delta-1, partial [Trichinella patagoniensis]